MRFEPTALRTLALVLGAAVLATVPLMFLGGDKAVADLLYSAQGNSWRARDAWLTSTVVHKWGKSFSIACWLALALAWAMTWSGLLARRWLRPLSYVLVTTVLSALLVALLKGQTGMDCPWDLIRYGGDRLDIGLLTTRPGSMPRAACFPAGHASAGYGWVALYFALAATAPRWRLWGLGFGLLMGMTFGLSQQLRGAHFLSHDLWTLVISWTVASISARLWLQVASKPNAADSTRSVNRTTKPLILDKTP